MNHKVLLADDSLTIQKVIKITLAQQPYDITDCSTEDELFAKLPVIQPKIVFLDFNLSENYTGYELTAKIKSLLPSTKVLLLLGTFDSVDEAAMEKCGASDKIVKPFDSNKFISVCRQLVETFMTAEDLEYPEPLMKNETPVFSNPDDQWTVTNSAKIEVPVIATEPEKILDSSFPQINALEQGLSDWSMNVPGVINSAETQVKSFDLPPVITAEKSRPAAASTKADATRDDIKFPANDDLEFPDLGSSGIEIQELPASAPSVVTKKPTYVSLEALAPIEMEEMDDADTGKFVIQNTFEPEDSNVKEIELQIQDEVAEDLWHVDEFEELKREVSTKMEEVKNNFQPTRNDFDDSLFGEIPDPDAVKWNDNSSAFAANQKAGITPDLKAEMETMVKKYVQEYMDQMFQKNVEKVSWEVIPDLAENLIRQELGKISNKILNEK